MIFNEEQLIRELYDDKFYINEYLAIFYYLLKLQCPELASSLIKTAHLVYPKNMQIRAALKNYEIEFPKKNETAKFFLIGLPHTGMESICAALDEVGYKKQYRYLDQEKFDGDKIESEGCEVISGVSSLSCLQSALSKYPNANYIYTSIEEENSTDTHQAFDRTVKLIFKEKTRLKLTVINVGESDGVKWKKLVEQLDMDFVPLKPFAVAAHSKRSPEQTPLVRGIAIDDPPAQNLRYGKYQKPPVLDRQDYENFIVQHSEAKSPLRLVMPTGHECHYALETASGERSAVDLLRLDDCILTLDLSRTHGYKYYIFDKDGKFLEKVSHGKMPFRCEKTIHVNETVAFIDDRFTKFNVCHLLMDKIPRIYEFEKLPIDKFIILGRNGYTDTLARILGVRFLDIFDGNPQITSLRIKRLYLTSSSSYQFIHPGQNVDDRVSRLSRYLKQDVLNLQRNPYSKLLPAFVRSYLFRHNLSFATSNRTKLFISRESSKTRTIVNLEEVRTFFRLRGFDFVELEECSVNEQIRLFMSASAVVGVHGAGLTNIMFCRKGTRVLEILPPLCATSAFWKIANAFDLNYECVLAEDEDLPKPDYTEWKHNAAKYNRRDVIINLDKVKAQLEMLGEF